MVSSYGQGLAEHVAQGIGNAVKDILDKRVIRCVVRYVHTFIALCIPSVHCVFM